MLASVVGEYREQGRNRCEARRDKVVEDTLQRKALARSREFASLLDQLPRMFAYRASFFLRTLPRLPKKETERYGSFPVPSTRPETRGNPLEEGYFSQREEFFPSRSGYRFISLSLSLSSFSFTRISQGFLPNPRV